MDTIRRETYEEAGVYINNIQTIGYIIAKNIGDSEESIFPEVSILPVTISFVVEVDKKWKQRETLGREVLRIKEVKDLLAKRKDNNQLLEIFEYVRNYLETQNYEDDFSFYEKGEFEEIPTTQVMLFCKDKDNKFCIVRDFDENFFSLPGGGCRLDEEDIQCIKREVFEEA